MHMCQIAIRMHSAVCCMLDSGSGADVGSGVSGKVMTRKATPKKKRQQKPIQGQHALKKLVKGNGSKEWCDKT